MTKNDSSMEIQVLGHECDCELECFYRDYEITVSRELYPRTYGDWYMHVRNEEGEIVCDGWIDDSSGLSLRQAFNAACVSAELELPTTWPELK